jgi:hypothetical protein
VNKHWVSQAALIATIALTVSACVAGTLQPGTGRHISNRELTMEKSGRVVDVDTGAGVPGVKVIVNWETNSSGIPGYSSTGGTWCDLQRIVTTDADGNYTIPDVSKELDISDRGTRIGKTAFGLASATHDKDYVLTVFKPGYVRVGDMEKVKQIEDLVRRRYIGGPSLMTIPDARFSAGKVAIKPILMKKIDVAPFDLWSYNSIILTDVRCSDRMANRIVAPEMTEIEKTMSAITRPVPCSMPADTHVDPENLGAFDRLSHPGVYDSKFFNRVKELGGLPPTVRFDPLERVNTTAGILCRVITEEGKQQ